MEGNSWRPAAPPDDLSAVGSSDDWRKQLLPEARQRIVNKIMDTLKRHLPISVPEGLNELKKIAVRFEEKIYTAATTQSDYLRKISLKMLSMETKTQVAASINPSLSNPTIGNQSPSDSVPALTMQPQVGNQGQSLAMPLVNQSQVRQSLLPQNLQNNNASSALQGSGGLPSALPSIAGLNQSTIPNAGQTSNLQNISGLSQNMVNNAAGQGITQNIYASQQRQIQNRQQQQQSQTQLHYQQQLQQQLMKQKVQHSSLLPPHMQQQQQQQSLLQPNQLQSSQQPLMQMTSNLQSGQSNIQQTQSAMMQSAPQPSLQQNQQQSLPSLLPHQQSIARQQQGQPSMHQQSSSLQQQSTPISQQMVMPSQQQQLMGQQSNMSNMQQPQLLGQQNSGSDLQPQQQQQRLSGQQNNMMSMQQSQLMMNQQTMALHNQQQLGSQNNISGLQHPQQQLQQQQLLGSQSSGMHTHQRSMHMLQQPKSVAQQQNQQSSLTSLQSQGQQSQHQPSQQQMMPQQSPQLQQQMAMQQQNSLQREMHQRLQASGSMLQSQNTIEQQKQANQSQRGLQEVSSSTPMDSTTPGHDWQEEIYQKVKSMKELYYAEISELHQKISLKIQQLPQSEALGPPAKQSEQFEKLKQFKQMLERTMIFLQLSKNNIQLNMKDRLPMYEKQIMSFVSSNRNKKVAPPQQQGQPQFPHPSGHSMPQQQPSQVPQLQPHDNLLNQSQQMNLQGSVSSMQNSSSSSMQQGSVPLTSHVTVPATQQNMANALQPQTMDPMQGSSFSSLQQGAMGSMQQVGLGSLQNTITAPQQSSNALQQQQLQQQQQEQQNQLKQLQQRQMQQLYQQQQKQQMLQQAPMQQQLHQQKQQQTSQVPVHQLPQLHQMNDVRQGPGIKPGIYQQHYSGSQRHNYYQQKKPGTSFPISSPQNPQASSPQISQSSPQIDQHNLLLPPKTGTPTNSPFVVPSPSPSTPIPPSPLSGDPEKPSGVSTLPNTASAGYQQQTNLASSQTQALAVGTPGISASPLLAEFTSPDGSQANPSAVVPRKSSTTEDPLDRLIKVVQSMSAKALSASISDIKSVVSMTDRVAGSAPGNGSRAAVGEDLVAMTKCRLQARNFVSQDGNTATRKMKRHTSAMPLNAVSSAGSFNDSFKQSYSLDTSELESTATSCAKKRKIEVNQPLLDEIRDINRRLIDTVVAISDDDADSSAASVSVSDGTVIKFTFVAVAVSQSLKSLMAAKMSPIMPLRLLVPADYPKCSPIIIDNLPVEASKEIEDLSVKAQSTFSRALRCLSEPMSVGEMAKTWNSSVRKVITEFAQQNGGGCFSSYYGTWESCVSA